MPIDNGHQADAPVIIVGAGLSGLATALGVALRGRRAIVLEAAELVGGAAAYSGGQVWVGGNHVQAREGIDDDLDGTERYVRAIAHDDPECLDEPAMLRWLHTAPEVVRYWEEVGAIRWAIIPGLADYHGEADGALGEGRYLTNQVIDGSALGEWRPRLRVSPFFPVGTTYADMFEKGRRLTQVDSDSAATGEHAGVPAFGVARGEAGPAVPAHADDPLTFGTGVVASFLSRVLQEDGIEILTEHRVTELLTEDGTVVGVRAADREFRGPVVLATSTYDWDPDLVRDFLGLEPDEFGSVGPDSIRGDGIKLARSVGGATARIPATSVPILPGWQLPSGSGYGYGPEYAMPHCIIVDRTGRRYCDDSYWVDIVAKTLAPGDRHLPFFLIWDDEHRRDYGLGGTPPGGAYPGGWVESAPTLRELAERLGVDGEELERTVTSFNLHAARGEDPEYGRGANALVVKWTGDPHHEPSPVLGALERPPFHGMRLRFVGTAIGSSGVHIDPDGHVVNDEGGPIDGLYAVGSCAALTTTGTGYNSGFALGRGLTLAYLVAAELGGAPVPHSSTARSART